MMLNCENTKDETEKLIYRCLASLEAETLDSYERMQSEETLNNVTLTLDLLNEGQRDATHRKELLERELEEWKVELEKLKAAASHPDTDAGRQVGNENTHPSTQRQENVEVEKHSANRKQDTCQSADTKDVSTLDTFVCDQEKVAANALTEMSSGSGYECGEFGDNLPVQYEVMMVDQAAILESIRLSQESTQARSCDENNAGHNVEAQQQVHVKYIDTASRHKDQKPVFHSGTKYTRDERQASSRQVIQRPPPDDHAYTNQSPTVPDTTWDRPIRHYELVSQTNADQHPLRMISGGHTGRRLHLESLVVFGVSVCGNTRQGSRHV
nr:hypothetical protein BaRGS_035284 [Batillaria attramentaria]